MAKLLLSILGIFTMLMIVRLLIGNRPKQLTTKRYPNLRPKVDFNLKPELLLPCPQCGVHISETDLSEHLASQHPSNSS